VVQSRRRERLDFWNNSTAIKAEDAPKMGTILHRSVGATTSGQGEGTLAVTTEWVDPRASRCSG